MRPARSLPFVLLCLLAGFAGAAPRAYAHEGAHRELKALEKRHGAALTDPQELLRRGELHRLLAHWDAARADYDAAARRAPDLVEVDVCRAALFLDTAEPAAAIRLLDAVLTRVPDHGAALELRACAHGRLGRPLEAAADLDRVLAGPKRATPDLYHERARWLASAGPEHVVHAVAGLDEARARLGRLPSLELYAIELEARRGAWDLALERLERLAPSLAPRAALERRGDLLAAAGRLAAARAAYAAALAEIEAMSPARRQARTVAEQESRLRERLASGDRER